jgi:hypothetical protein
MAPLRQSGFQGSHSSRLMGCTLLRRMDSSAERILLRHQLCNGLRMTKLFSLLTLLQRLNGVQPRYV